LTYHTLKIERDDAVLIIGLNRPDKRNAFDLTMLGELATVYGDYDADDTLRAAVLYGEGKHFTAGLDLASVAPEVAKGTNLVPEGGIDPWQVHGRSLAKPLVVAVHGRCLTLGIELMLSADIAVAAATTTFNQMEVARGVVPWGGATIRFPRAAGWGNAMRWMLTAEDFDAEEARRIGIVQEITPDGTHLARATELAHTIARQAPLAVRATLANARLASRAGAEAAEHELEPTARRVLASDDARIGLEAFRTRTTASYLGR